MSTLKTLAAGTMLALAALASSGAHAQGASGIDQREANQQMRIHRGVATGQLTSREAWRLRHQQRNVRRAEAMARADGVVTPQERRRLRHMQTRASRDIYLRKHNPRTVYRP